MRHEGIRRASETASELRATIIEWPTTAILLIHDPEFQARGERVLGVEFQAMCERVLRVTELTPG